MRSENAGWPPSAFLRCQGTRKAVRMRRAFRPSFRCAHARDVCCAPALFSVSRQCDWSVCAAFLFVRWLHPRVAVGPRQSASVLGLQCGRPQTPEPPGAQSRESRRGRGARARQPRPPRTPRRGPREAAQVGGRAGGARCGARSGACLGAASSAFWELLPSSPRCRWRSAVTESSSLRNSGQPFPQSRVRNHEMR